MTGTTSRRASNRALMRRYRAPLLAAIPSGVLGGVIADVALSLQTVSAARQDQLPALFIYACIGAAFALVACTGAAVGVLASRGRTQVATPFLPIAAGAGLAVLLGVLLLGGISTAVTDSWGWFPAIAVIAVVTSLISSVAAPATAAAFQHLHRLLP